VSDFLLKKDFFPNYAQLFIAERCCTPRVGNLSLVAGQIHTLQDMARRTNFPPTIPFPLLFVMFLQLGNLWIYNQINS